jgi:soluble lytic murein transglycosylase-like protein
MWGGRMPGSCAGARQVLRSTPLGILAFLVLVPLPGFAGPFESGRPPAVAAPDARGSTASLQQLPGLRHVFASVRVDLRSCFGDDTRAVRLLGSVSDQEAVLQALPPTRRAEEAAIYRRADARWAEFERLLNAVVGRSGTEPSVPYGAVLARYLADRPLPVRTDDAAFARDRIVLSMAISGYRPDVIADVVTGRVPIHVAKQAAKLRLLGYTAAQIARYVEPPATGRTAVLSPGRIAEAGRSRVDEAVVHHARQHGIDPDLVRAVITHESAWNSGARSHKGAIGLMQLMPDTARLLGVNPFDPEQNVAGGVRYLADLRGLFGGNLDAMIVGYVAGPTYAQRWLQGKTVLDDEVRAYLKNVKGSYGRQSAW